MDKDIDEQFVKNFVVKDRRERVFFELSSIKKREDRIPRLYNDLDKRYSVCSLLTKNNFPPEIVRAVDKKTDCYIIADGVDDGMVLAFEKAFNNLDQATGVYIIYCAPDIVFAKDEVCYDAPEQCILYRKERLKESF